ncbi:MAG: hypothetical protein MSG64_04325, partial [Pyrinomonadaceae bacterium MAG19_C2-C3]|nr:hypothetical protein [Pyrinomonadaceae bacterium MAG19_C2-C3]
TARPTSSAIRRQAIPTGILVLGQAARATTTTLRLKDEKRGRVHRGLAAHGLKGLLQEIEPITKCLITRQMRKPRFPIIDGEFVNRFFLKQSIFMTEEEDGNQFLVSKSRNRIIAQTLKTRLGASIVSLTAHADIIELVDFPSQENPTNLSACLSFQLLIRIFMFLPPTHHLARRVCSLPKPLDSKNLARHTSNSTSLARA